MRRFQRAAAAAAAVVLKAAQARGQRSLQGRTPSGGLLLLAASKSVAFDLTTEAIGQIFAKAAEAYNDVALSRIDDVVDGRAKAAGESGPGKSETFVAVQSYFHWNLPWLMLTFSTPAEAKPPGGSAAAGCNTFHAWSKSL